MVVFLKQFSEFSFRYQNSQKTLILLTFKRFDSESLK